jgi:hypothetical protein
MSKQPVPVSPKGMCEFVERFARENHIGLETVNLP